MIIAGIDPGTRGSGIIVFGFNVPKDLYIMEARIEDNNSIAAYLQQNPLNMLAIEKINYIGGVVGNDTFETAIWIGRFIEIALMGAVSSEPEVDFNYILIPPSSIRAQITGTTRSKDKDVRQALLNKLGPQGKKAQPGPTYGFKSHIWSAAAVAVTWIERNFNICVDQAEMRIERMENETRD